MRGTDDRRGLVRTWQDETLQYHQYYLYQRKNSTCNLTGWSDRTQRNLVGTFRDINRKRNHIYMYISVDNEETSSEEFIKLATESKEKCIVVQRKKMLSNH